MLLYTDTEKRRAMRRTQAILKNERRWTDEVAVGLAAAIQLSEVLEKLDDISERLEGIEEVIHAQR